MLNAIKMLAVTAVVAASVSSAFAAVTSRADSGPWVGSSVSYSNTTDRDSMVKDIGN
jgi:hypothetical protein